MNVSNMSATMSSGGRSELHAPSSEYCTAGLVFHGFVFTIGVVVNLTALWVFALTTKKRSSVTVYMINVAAVDLLFVALLPFRMAYDHSGRWPFGDVFCRVSAALTVVYPCLALWLFALISADRYAAIVQPRHSKDLKNVPKALAGCVGVWILTLGGSVALLFPVDDPDRASNFTTCVKTLDIVHLRRDNNTAVDVVRLAFFFLVPVAMMVYCYVVIADNLFRGRTSKLKPKVKQKSIRIVVTIIVQMLVCFVPFHVCLAVRLLGPGGGGGDGGAYRTWAAFTTYLMNLSTVLDIILYYIVSKQFQDRVISVILYRNYLRSVRRKSRRGTHTGSVRSLSNLPGTMM